MCYITKVKRLEKIIRALCDFEVSMPLDGFSKKHKGFFYVTCMFPEKLIKAFNELDGIMYQVKFSQRYLSKAKLSKVKQSSSMKQRFIDELCL